MRMSSYINPQNMKFGQFINDLTNDEIHMRAAFLRMLTMAELRLWDQDRTDHSNAVIRLKSALRYGAYYKGVLATLQSTSLHEMISCGYDQPNHRSYQDRPNDGWYDGFGFWYDPNERLFCVLEWNNFRGGLITRKYKPMKFIEKFMSVYDIGYSPETLKIYTAEIFQNIIDAMLPDERNLTVAVIDKPSDIYLRYRGINSCMMGKAQTRFYDNTDKVKAVAVFTGDSSDRVVVARALIWTLDDGRRICGRIYSSISTGEDKINKWCDDNGVLRNCEFYTSRFENSAPTVTLPVCPFGVPYQDDFRVGFRRGDNIHIFLSNIDAVRAFDPTDAFIPVDGSDPIVDLCFTSHTPGWLCESLIRCKRTSRQMQVSNAVYVDGDAYCYSLLPLADPYTLHLMDPNDIVKHPYRHMEAVRIRDLEVQHGLVVLRSEKEAV